MSLRRAFADPVHDAQAAYRGLLAALAEPFLPVVITAVAAAPSGLGSACAAACLTLLDNETEVWLQPSFDADVRQWLAFHTRCAFVSDPGQAQFAVLGAPLEAPPLDAFNAGTITRPQSSATLLIQVQSFESGVVARARGPGIEGGRTLAPEALPPTFWRQWTQNSDAFPLGIDVFLFAGISVVGLPRTTRVDLGAH